MDSRKARKEIGIWIRLHPHNVGQRVQVIVEHFRQHVQQLLGGRAKAMVVANKFQTGFDQPKLCAMYVLKPLKGVDCVQTLSRLNRTYPGKEETGTFILDFVNDPQDVLESFLPYHKTAALSDVSDPNQVHALFDKLGSAGIYQWSEVGQFAKVYFDKKKSDQALSSICKPARDRWREQYRQASRDLKLATDLVKRARKSGDAVLVANAENEQRDTRGRKDALDKFKKDLGTYARFYEFISQIVDFDEKDLEMLNLYARHLYPLLREEEDEEAPDLTNVQLTHYRLQKQREQDLMLNDAEGDEQLHPGGEFGTGQGREKMLEPLSVILGHMNDLFAASDLSDADKVSYAQTIAAKILENDGVMAQVRNNTPEQAMLGDFPNAVEEAVLASGDAHQELMAQFLAQKSVQVGFARMLLEMLSKSV